MDWTGGLTLKIIFMLSNDTEGGERGGLALLIPRPSHHPVFDCSKTGWWEGLGTRLEETVFPILCGSRDRPAGKRSLMMRWSVGHAMRL